MMYIAGTTEGLLEKVVMAMTRSSLTCQAWADLQVLQVPSSVLCIVQAFRGELTSQVGLALLLQSFCRLQQPPCLLEVFHTECALQGRPS